LSGTQLVIFDVDGTLHDTFRWWAPVVRRGIAAFAEREGMQLALPDDRAADAVVGMKDDEVWGAFLPDDQRHRWRDLREVVVPLEVAELHRRDYLFPGVRELLVELREHGVAIALASNCRSRYMAGVRDGQGLGDLVDAFYCLDSNGVETKTDMLRLACDRFGRPATMVGDREPDLEAAVANGLPFVWRENDRCDLSAGGAVWRGGVEDLLGILGLDRIS